MQSIKWLGFCVAQTMSRSVLHFFPSSDNASAPYAASCTLTLFGAGGVRSSVVLEGGRLGHPDGLRLEDAFPALKGEASGVFGLEVEISTPQPRLDVTSSGCVVEIVSQGLPVRFAPKKLLKAEVSETIRQLRAKSVDRNGAAAEKAATPEVNAETSKTVPASGWRGPSSGLAVRDGQHVPSLMIVNGSSEPCSAAVYSVSAGLPKPSMHVPLTKVDLAPGASQELQLDEGFFRGGDLKELSLGRCSALPLVVEVSRRGNDSKAGAASGGENIPEVASFMVYREAATRRMSSVTSLG
jgi:hypothetical protein